MAPLLGLIMTTLSLTSCVSWAMRWKISPPTVRDQIGAAALDVLTLPIQAIAIPTSFALDHHSQSKKTSPEPIPTKNKPSSKDKLESTASNSVTAQPPDPP
jgi:hypothetical protein